LEDLNSRNGTYVNGQRLRGRHPLRSSDRVDICDVVMTFHREQETPPPKLRLVEEKRDSSIVTSTLDVSSSDSRMRLGVNPEDKLHAMLEIIESLGTSLEVNDVLPKILDSLFQIFIQADHGFVVLIEEGENLVPKMARRRGAQDDEEIGISLSVMRRAIESRQAILSEDAASDERFEKSNSVADLHIRSMICAPLVNSQGRALGAIQMEARDGRSHFRGEDLDVLASIARLTTFAVENAQLHEMLLDKQATERDLLLAREVQRGFLPHTRPRIEGYEFFDFYEPARQVGGDYYDYIRLPGERLAVVVADVSGKGVPAALLMARLCTEMRYCLVSERRPSEAVTHLNASFMEHWREDHIVTLALVVIDLRGHSATVVIAGHMPPLLRRGDRPLTIVGDEVRGLPIGVHADEPYRQCTLRLVPGDMLTMFTDGLSDARNPAGDLYGLARLQSELARPASTVGELGQQVLADIKAYVGKQRQADDMCMVCVGRLAT
jgi:serine phosphatase RsbU (regulator of sigma subunit)